MTVQRHCDCRHQRFLRRRRTRTQGGRPSEDEGMARSRLSIFAALALGLAGATGALAADPASCKSVRFSDVSWTDITATTAIASRLLEGLGYEPKIQVLAVPVTYTSMKNKNFDVFLVNWMPTMEADRKPYVEDKSVEVLGANLEGAKYTLAVPKYLADQGLKTFADIAKFQDK